MDRRLLACLSGLLFLATTSILWACPFCGPMQGQTLSKEVQQARFVVFGPLSNPQARLNPDGTESGTTDLTIEAVIKDHEYLKGKKVLVVPRYIPVQEKDAKLRFLLFCDLFQERVDPYRGLPMLGKDVVAYLNGATRLEKAPAPERLKFFFQYLDHEDPELATDAYREFAASEYRDVLGMIQGSDRAQLRARLVHWLRDPNTPAFRLGFYGMLLGHCGDKAADLSVYQELLADEQRAQLSGLDGILAGYVLLDPAKGWKHLEGVLSNPALEFTTRYAGLRAVRFLWDFHPDLVPKKTLLAALARLVEQRDIADLAIDDLRKWGEWSLTEKVLSYFSAESHDVSIVKRAIIKYALRCPEPAARAFIAEQRKLQPERVREIEELLELEVPTPSVTPTPKPATQPGGS
jgi:hypothetical protein